MELTVTNRSRAYPGRSSEDSKVDEVQYVVLKVCLHEWLSGGVSPCQGEGRGFESRLVLFLLHFLMLSTQTKNKKADIHICDFSRSGLNA